MISIIKKIGLASGLMLAFTLSAQAAVSVSLDELLQQVKTGRVTDAAENKARLDEFRANRAQQSKLLNDEKAVQKRQEDLSARMEAQFEVNDGKILQLEQQFQERLGGLKELFGVLQQGVVDFESVHYLGYSPVVVDDFFSLVGDRINLLLCSSAGISAVFPFLHDFIDAGRERLERQRSKCENEDRGH